MARTGTVALLPDLRARRLGALRRSRSRTGSTLRASKRLRPCWTNPSVRLRPCFFEHSLSLMSVAVLKHLWPMNRKYSTGLCEDEQEACSMIGGDFSRNFPGIARATKQFCHLGVGWSGHLTPPSRKRTVFRGALKFIEELMLVGPVPRIGVGFQRMPCLGRRREESCFRTDGGQFLTEQSLRQIR